MISVRRATVSVLISLAAVALLPLAGLGDERAAVPKAEDIAKAEQLIKEVFGDELKKTKSADLSAVACKLLQQAGEENSDPAAKFVMLKMSRDLAAKAGDAVTAMKAAGEMATAFQIGQGEARAAVADALAASATSAPVARTVTEELVSASEAAVNDDDFVAAAALLKSAETAARKAQNVSLVVSVQGRLKSLNAVKAEADKVKEHIATLKKTPDDPAANSAVGRFYCVTKRDWDAGVPLLAKGADAKLKAAAEKDAKAGEGEAGEKVAAADAWYELAGSDAGAKVAWQLRAHHWYAMAVPDLKGLDKLKSERRLAELQTVVESRVDKGRVFASIRKAVTDKKTKSWNIIGAAFSRTTYEEVPQEGAILVGFHYTTINKGEFPGFVQPIWLTARGEIAGKPYGKPEAGTKVLTVKGKPGYAVGAIFTRGGGGFDAFKPIFMRMTEKGVNPNDKYEGPHIGGNGGGDGTLGGDGNFIVGIHGKVNDQGKMQALSPVTLTAESPAMPKTKKKNS